MGNICYWIAIYLSTDFLPIECLHVSFLMLFSMFLFVLRAVRVEVGLKSSCAHGIGARRVVQLDSGIRVSIARVGSKWGGEKGLIVKKS